MSSAPRGAPSALAFDVLLACGVLATLALVLFVRVAPDALEPHERTHLPKELALLSGACVLGALGLWRARVRPAFDALDALAAAAALTGVWSALRSIDGDTGLRLASITAGGAVLFVAVRGLDAKARALVEAGCVALLVLAAIGVLAEALVGVRLSLPGYAPGGTIGQRNNAAHVLALGAPLVIAAVTHVRGAARVVWVLACAVVVAAVLVTRSRVGLLGLGVGVVTMAVSLGRGGERRALALTAIACVVGLGVVAVRPALHWRSRTPYADTARALIDLDSGSGHGRLVQARSSLALVADAPVLGVGPGHWAVHYPKIAEPDDVTVHRDSLRPTNRLLTNDVVALVVERGLLGALLCVAWGALVWLRRRRELLWVTPTGLVLGVLMVGDCVVQIATGVAFVSVLAALSSPSARAQGGSSRAREIGAALLMLLLLGVVGVGAARAADRLAAQQALAHAPSPESIVDVARSHPAALAPRFMLIERAQANADCASIEPWLSEALARRPFVPRLEQARAACR